MRAKGNSKQSTWKKIDLIWKMNWIKFVQLNFSQQHLFIDLPITNLLIFAQI